MMVTTEILGGSAISGRLSDPFKAHSISQGTIVCVSLLSVGCRTHSLPNEYIKVMIRFHREFWESQLARVAWGQSKRFNVTCLKKLVCFEMTRGDIKTI